MRFAIDTTDRLLRDGRDFRFEGRRNGELDFVDDRAGERLVFTDLELAAEVAAGRATLVRGAGARGNPPEPPAPRFPDLALLTPPEREKARTRLSYVQAAWSAGLDDGRVANSALARVIAAAAVRLGDANPPCIRSLRRWLRRGGQDPVAGRFVTRNRAKGNRTRRLAPEVVDIVEGRIDAVFLARPPVSVATLHDHVRTAVNDRNEAQAGDAAPLAVPSIDAVRRQIELRPPRDVVAARYGEARARRQFDMVHSQVDPEAPLDLVELDHTVTDLMVVCGETSLPFGRATLAAAMCRCTRMPFGIYLGFEPPSVHSVMQCLRNGMLPKLYLDEKVAAGVWVIKHRWPVCGRPRTLLLDRAMENLGEDLDAFAGEVGVSLRFAPRKTPWFKGGIERFFRTLNSRLLHEQRGTTFSNVLARDDYDPAKHAVITYEELLYLLHRYLLDVYACGIHKGLRDVPARLWDELTVRYPIQPVAAISDLDALFGRVERRVVQRVGITFEHIRYVSQELVALLNDPRFRAAAPTRQVRFRYDPADLRGVRVFNPCSERYFEVPAERQDYARGLSLWQHRLIVAAQNRRNEDAADIDGCARAKVEIAAYFAAAMAGGRSGARKNAARYDGVGRLSPAGASHATSPEGSVDAERRRVGKPPPARRRRGPPGTPALPPLQPVADAIVAQPGDQEDIYASLGIAR